MQPGPGIHVDSYTVHGQDGRRAVFDGLLREDWGSTHAGVESGLKVLWELLECGGDLPLRLIASAERDYDDYKVAQKNKSRIRVLAVDLAAVPPVATAGPRSGKLIYDCMVDPEKKRNWYQDALQHYFDTFNAPSLLSFDTVQREPTTCKLATWKVGAQRAGHDSSSPSIKLGARKRDFRYTTVRGLDVDQRFREYCSSISQTIEPSLLSEPDHTLAVLWMHVSLPKAHDIKGNDQGVLWSVSLFATLLVADTDPDLQTGAATSLMSGNDPPQGDSGGRDDELWRRTIDAVHQFLMLGAHESFEQYRTAGRARALTGQAIAHEFKNLTQDISLIASPMYRSIVDLSERFPDLEGEFEEISQRARRLAMLGRLTSGVSLATYWLTHEGVLQHLVFHPDEGCKVLLAVTRLALSLCSTAKRAWTIVGADMDEDIKNLAAHLHEVDPDQLFDRVDLALLLFVAFEPVRNIRNPKRVEGWPSNVKIETLVEEPYVVIRQTTHESAKERPSDIDSPSSRQINQVLVNVMGKDEIFAEIDPTVRVVEYRQESPNCGYVVRETRIRAQSFPMKKTTPDR